MFDVKVEIDEFVGSWLAFDPEDRTAIGRKNAVLGRDMLLGSSVFSVEDKIRIRLYVKNFAQYERFLPSKGSNLSKPLADAVFFYIGDELDWDVELAIPAGEVAPVRLGLGGRLGWTSWVSPNWASTDAYRCDARFHLTQRREANAEVSEKAVGPDRGPV
jgi:type VI secretion system protein ImpH